MNPVADLPITTPYGAKGPEWSSGHHEGVDFRCDIGTPVLAATNGKVIYTGNGYSGQGDAKSGPDGWGSAFGNHILVETTVNGKGYVWITAHLSHIGVTFGQKVIIDQVIGKSGDTGNVTGPHVHFEARMSNNVALHADVDPAVLLKVKPTADDTKRLNQARKENQ